MDAALWVLLMHIGPVLGCLALVGIPIRTIQLFSGNIKRRFRRLAPWAKAIVGVGAVSGVFVVAAAGGVVYALYSHITCNSGGGCAQGEFSVAFSAGVFGLTYVVFELLLLPLGFPASNASHA
jgi:hypothetical protein